MVGEFRKLVGPEKLEPTSVASVAEALKGIGYGGSGVVLKYGKQAPLPFPMHSHNTPAVELVVQGVFKYTFDDGLVCLFPGQPLSITKDNLPHPKTVEMSKDKGYLDDWTFGSTVPMVYNSSPSSVPPARWLH